MMRTIFDAGPQRKMVWFAAFCTLVTGVVLIWLGEWSIRTYGLSPVEGGVLKPLVQRVLLGGSFIAAGVAMIAGFVVYLHCYVARIEEDTAGGGFRLTVLWPFGGRQRTVMLDDVAAYSYNVGFSRAGGITVNAPWSGLRLHGRRLPFIIDEQGDFPVPYAVDRLLEGVQPPVEERTPTRKYRKQLARRRRA
jgi:hypothetical protein